MELPRWPTTRCLLILLPHVDVYQLALTTPPRPCRKWRTGAAQRLVCATSSVTCLFLNRNIIGPACGRCFKLTLVAPVTASPPFFPSVVKSVVVKVTDLCPLSRNGWCSGTASKPNASVIPILPGSFSHWSKPSAGQYINFDLVYPSSAIPDDFFPSNVTLYGYTVRAPRSCITPANFTIFCIGFRRLERHIWICLLCIWLGGWKG